MKKQDLKIAFQVLTLMGRIFNYWNDKSINQLSLSDKNLEKLSDEQINNLLKYIESL